MRPDMHKVVVERPRAGGGPQKRNRHANLDWDLLPRQQGVRRPYTHRKRFTDVLGPLRRWLRSQVGRPWNAVYSEACAVIQPDSVVRAHIKTHLFEMVQRHTFLREGKVWSLDPTQMRDGERPIRESRSPSAPFYVHPKSGLLSEVKPPWHRPWRWHISSERREAVANCRWLSNTQALVRVDGLWFRCTMEAIPLRLVRGESPTRFDLIARQRLSRAEAYRRYGRNAVCVAKRQLSRRELRDESLANEAVAGRLFRADSTR